MGAKLLFSAILGAVLWGQESGVPVIIDGREVARIYGSTGTFSAKDRAPKSRIA